MASEIRANSITSRAGLSTVTMTDSGPMFSGITTFVDNSGFTFGVGGGTSIFTPATNILTLGTNNTEKVRIDANGNANITGVTTAANFKTGVSNLHNAGLTLSGGQLDVGSNIKVGTAGVITATTFSGSGASLTALNASNISSGTVPTARLGSGTASSSTFLAGDSTYKTLTSTTINNNADNRLITGSGTANTLEGESTLTFDGTKVRINAGSGSNLQIDGTASYLQVAGVKVWVGAGNRSHNTAVGNGALASASGGDDCTAIGHNAYQNGTTGEDNTVVGSHAMDAVVTGHRNCAFGHASLSNLTSGYDNSCYGRLSGLEMLGGYNNTYMGSQAGEKTIGANNNTFLGFKAGLDITTGNQNVAVGSYAFNKQTETSFNVAIGHYSQHWSSTNSAGNNVSIGHEALRGASNASPLTGGRNVAIGRGCMEDCRSGYRNTAIGWESLRNINNGYENVCLGYEAGRTISTGNENILIGASAAPSSTSVSREMFIGNGTAGNGANTFYVHSTSGAYNGTNNQHWNQTSDERIKKNITNFDTGLSVINQLQVRNFEYKTEDEIKSDNPELTDALQSMKNVLDISGVQKGLIAQEAEAVSSDFVTTPSTGVKALIPDEIFWHMLNSIKELSTKVDALEQENIALRARVTNLEGN